MSQQTRRKFLETFVAALALGSMASGQEKPSPNKASAGAKSIADDNNLQIAILLYDKMTALDAIGPYEVLSRMPNAKVYFVGETAGLKTVDTKMLTLKADYALSEIPNPNILLIPGGNPTDAMKSEKVLSWIREAHKTSQFTTSVCTGAMILGAAGLLKNLKATTHWATRELLKNFGAEYVPARYVEQGKIITAAGVSAGIDMGLYLVEKIHGKETAEMLQLAIEYDPQPPVNQGSLQKADKKTIDAALRYFAERRTKN